MPDRLHEGRQGSDGADRRPGLLERPWAPYSRLRRAVKRVPTAAANRAAEPPEAGREVRDRVPQRADGGPRPAQVVVRLPSARGRRRATPDQRRADAQSTPYGRPACSRPHTRQPEGGPQATRPFLDLYHPPT